MDTKITTQQMFNDIADRCDPLPIHVENTVGRCTMTIGEITITAKTFDEAIAKAYADIHRYD